MSYVVERNSRLPKLLAPAACLAALLAAQVAAAALPEAPKKPARGGYVVVVSKETHAHPEWKAVVEALVKKHAAAVLTFAKDPGEALAGLSSRHPRYTCFVAQPAEATREFVAAVHKLTRKYDEDPYTDTLWGILTGYDAAGALKSAEHSEPLTVRKVASGTEVALEMCHEGIVYDELVKNKMVRKLPGGRPEILEGPDDTTQALVDALNEYKADLFVTSGHATEHDWMIGYRYKNGSFISEAGQMYGRDTRGRRIEIHSENPKVYLPVGNCLMGHIDGRDCMALAWMNDVGVKQMIGYTVPTWFGYAGWGCLDYFLEQPGRYTFTEAFFANQHSLIHHLTTTETNKRGLQFDSDVVAFYGDPGWEARMADAEKAYSQELTEEDGVYTFAITPKRGADSFKPINTNGSQRGWRPVVHFLPERVRSVEILAGADLKPVVADDFILIPNPRTCDASRKYIVRFRAARVNASPKVASQPER